RTRTRALGLHLALEARQVHRHAARGSDLLGQLDGEPVRIVERERLRARNRLRALREQALEPLHPRLVGLAEAGLFLLEQPQDALAMRLQLAIVPAEALDHLRRHACEERARERQ